MMMMKVKLFTVGLTLGATMLLSNCNDDISLVGPSIQPESDKITVFQDSIRFKASTVQLDSIYARTVNGLLGELYDPLYGNLKSDYICQFYCPEGFKFKHTPIDGRIDSMIYQITYSSWVGDSLAPMQVQIYQVTKPLQKDYYTNIDPADFCDMQTSLGAKTYTAYDTSIPDWQREIDDTSDPDYYVPHVHVRMPQSLGQHIYDETLNNPASFETQEAFNNFFPGLYVTTTYGTGNILDVRSSSMLIYYRYNGTSSETGNDTIYTTIERFNTTQEVIQLNNLRNGNLEQLLDPDAEYAYMKTPAGVCIKLEVSGEQLKDIIGDHIVNNLPFSLTPMPQEDWDFAFARPSSLLLLPEDSVKSFFESGKLSDSRTSFLGTYSSSDNVYNFGNISRLMETHITENPDEDLRILIFPVENVTQSSSYHGTSDATTTAINNYMAPSGVKVKKDDESMTFVLTTSIYNE